MGRRSEIESAENRVLQNLEKFFRAEHNECQRRERDSALCALMQVCQAGKITTQDVCDIINARFHMSLTPKELTQYARNAEDRFKTPFRSRIADAMEKAMAQLEVSS